MPRTARPVTQGDINKICKGAMTAGLHVHGVKVVIDLVAKRSEVTLFTGGPADSSSDENEWDEVLVE